MAKGADSPFRKSFGPQTPPPLKQKLNPKTKYKIDKTNTIIEKEGKINFCINFVDI